VLAKLNSKDMTEAGPMSQIADDSGSDIEDRLDIYMPGVDKGDFSTRKTKPEVRTTAVQFSPTGRSWAAASTVGLVEYSLDESLVFDPYDLDIEVTPLSVRSVLADKEYTKALVMAFRLGEQELLAEVIEGIPQADVQLVAKTFPEAYLERLLTLLAEKLAKSPHLEYYLAWSCHILNGHSRFLKNSSAKMMTAFRQLQKALAAQHKTMSGLCNTNRYSLEYLVSRAVHADANAEIAEAAEAAREMEFEASSSR